MVYVRDKGAPPRFTFSHYCPSSVPKIVPESLRVRDLTIHPQQSNWSALRKACFLVLVAGDTAQCISVSNVQERRTTFLYHGSEYARQKQEEGHAQGATEIQDDYIPLEFYATMSWFTGGYLSCIMPLESGLVLFPRTITEKTLPKLASWVEASITKSIYTSLWVTDSGDSYNEYTRQIRTGYSRKRKRADANE